MIKQIITGFYNFNKVNKIYLLSSVKLQNVARENCSGYLEMQEKSLLCLKAWLKKTPHKNYRLSDELLLSFLRCCRYNFDDTKQRIIDFFTIKSDFPEIFSNRVIDETFMDLYHQGIHTILLKPLSSNGARIIISQYNKYDLTKTKPADVFRLLVILLEILANEDPNTSVCGVLFVVDARDVTMEQMLQYDCNLLKRIWSLVEHCLPIQFKAIHLINLRKEAHAVFKFVTSFLPEKMPIKFMIHKKAEDLYKHLPRDSLTVEYGGHNGFQREALIHWEKVVLKYGDYFSKDDKYSTNENFYIGRTKGTELPALIGPKGVFRKLDVN